MGDDGGFSGGTNDMGEGGGGGYGGDEAYGGRDDNIGFRGADNGTSTTDSRYTDESQPFSSPINLDGDENHWKNHNEDNDKPSALEMLTVTGGGENAKGPAANGDAGVNSLMLNKGDDTSGGGVGDGQQDTSCGDDCLYGALICCCDCTII